MKRLNHNARVLVTDGGRAIVFRNAGQVGHPDLRQFKVYAHDNPPTRELGTDKPARVNESVGHPAPPRSRPTITSRPKTASSRTSPPTWRRI